MLPALVLALSFLGTTPRTPNGCEAASDCTQCLGGTIGQTCGWCAVNTTTSTSVGPQCVDLHSTFDCDIQFQTATCTQGWKCQHNTTNNASQCVPSTGGIADKKTCEASCAHPPPSPKPTPPSPPKPPKQAYKCSMTNMTCSPSPFGDPTKSECEAHCKQSYQCDNTAKQCKPVAPNATGHHYYDKTECAKQCPLRPMPVPWEMRGIWRGLAIHNSYSPGEWVADITNASVAIWYPGASGYQLYMKGSASALGVAGKYVILVDSTKGKLVGKIRFLAADFSMNPEVKGFLQLAIDENNLAQEVTSFDTAMSTATVLSFETCPAGGSPAPPPPPPGPPPMPPPCKAKLDVVVVLDGSASIRSSDWQKALSFVNKLVGGFKISADQVELGVVQFSEHADTVIGLSDDASAITAAVSSLRQMRMNTNTYAGFTQAQSILSAQGRPGTKGKLVIIITDGVQNMGPPAKVPADALKASGVQIFGVGVGSGADPREIKEWCSCKTSTCGDHYFSVSAFDQLEKILQAIIANACPHPPSPPMAALPALLDASAGLGNVSVPKNCKFHLPANLPQAVADAADDTVEVAAVADADAAVPVEAAASSVAADGVTPWDPISAAPAADSCNTYTDCKSCIGQHSAGSTCGWCTGQITYAGSGSPSKFQCAGNSGAAASKFTCTGHFQTSSCDVPGGCGLSGVYRGLRIDNDYNFGEWQADFTAQNASEHVKITQLDASGAAASTVEGKVVCPKKCSEGKTDAGVPFTLTTPQGSILHGICGFTDQVQAETSGLMWALSNKGVGTPPKGFDEAMLNTSNAEVHTYYKCSDYKAKTCTFKAV